MTRALVLVCALTASSALAQQVPARRQCAKPVVRGERFASTDTPAGRMGYFGVVKGECRGTTMRIEADSAENNEATGMLTLIGRAKYFEDGSTIEANVMRYHERDLRIEAIGNVRAKSKDGNTLTVDLLNYYRRTQARDYVIIEGAGHSRLIIRDSLNVPDSAATVIESHRIRSERDSLFYAGGNVVITRPDLRATSDSAATNSGTRNLRLVRGTPTITGRGGRSFTVTAVVLDVFGKENALERLFAQGKAHAVSDSMDLTADTLDIKTTKDKIDRIAMYGPGRARAASPNRDIDADRIDLAMPGQQLRTLNAVGRARVSTKADSAIKTDERDWIEGDTVVATFDTLAAKDSTKQPPLRTLVARGSARSYYQVAGRDRPDSLGTINYVTGALINAQFADGAVRDVRVYGDVRGITLEPVRDTVTPPRRQAPPGRTR